MSEATLSIEPGLPAPTLRIEQLPAPVLEVVDVETGGDIVVQPEPDTELIFESVGIQGPPGPPSSPESGDAIRVVGEVIHLDISKLTFAP